MLTGEFTEVEQQILDPLPGLSRPMLLRDKNVKIRRHLYLPIKTSIEWLIALLLLIALSPLMVLLAVVIKLTSEGPIIYSQARLGLNGRTFRIIKFRTMIKNAEEGTGAIWASKDDSRITKVGSFLRNTHLDELPQLINILKGEMSLIGPRPERPEIALEIMREISGFGNRLALRPGVTGLAQMLLAADDPSDKRFLGVRRKLAHDVYYIEHVGLLLDLRIALSTPCFFLSEVVDAIRQFLVRPYRTTIEENYKLLQEDPEDFEQAF